SILFPILVGLIIGGFNPWLLAATGATVVMVLVGGFVTWRTLRYEITDDHIEIRKGLIRRERRTIPLERVRGGDVTSSLLHRMLGVSVVHIEALPHRDPQGPHPPRTAHHPAGTRSRRRRHQ